MNGEKIDVDGLRARGAKVELDDNGDDRECIPISPAERDALCDAVTELRAWRDEAVANRECNAALVETERERDRLAAELAELRAYAVRLWEAGRELVDIIDGALSDGAAIDRAFIDSFTTQPMRALLTEPLPGIAVPPEPDDPEYENA